MYKVKTLDKDPWVSIFSLREDIDGLQQTVHETWKRYQTGHISPVAASTKTEMAISLAQRMEKGYLATFPPYTS